MNAPITWRAVRVWQRNRDTFLRLWATQLWPPFAEPLFQFAAFGFGVGAYVNQMEGQSFAQYIAPGVLAVGVLFTSAFECLFGTFIRMQFQRTFEAIIATPVSIEEVIVGEMLWAATRGAFTAFAVLIVIAALGLVGSPLMALVVPLSAVAGFAFAAMAMVFTAIAPTIDHLNYSITFGLTPMFLLSGVYFPIETMPTPLAALVWAAPLVHAVRPFRALNQGTFPPDAWFDLAYLIVFGLTLAALSVWLMRRRLIK